MSQENTNRPEKRAATPNAPYRYEPSVSNKTGPRDVECVPCSPVFRLGRKKGENLPDCCNGLTEASVDRPNWPCCLPPPE